MKNRKLLEIDLQNYKNKYQELEHSLKEQQVLSGKLLTDAKDVVTTESNELQSSFLQNVKKMEEINIAMQETKNLISITHLLKNAKIILKISKHINERKQGLPLHWQQTQFIIR